MPCESFSAAAWREKNRSLVSEKVIFLSVRSNSTYRMLTLQKKKLEISTPMEVLTAFFIVATWTGVGGESRTPLMYFSSK